LTVPFNCVIIHYGKWGGIIKISLPSSETVEIPAKDIKKIIRSGDGKAALLYLYVLTAKGDINEKDAAKALKMTENEIVAAASVLGKLGLLELDAEIGKSNDAVAKSFIAGREVGAQDDDPADDTPSPAAPAPLNNGSEFKTLADEAQLIMGRPLSSEEMSILNGLYNEPELPAAVIMLLLHYCAEERQQSGDSRKPSMKTIEKRAYDWIGNGITTIETAEKYITDQTERRSDLGMILDALQFYGRKPVPTEKKYIDSWMSMGFKADAIEIAYEKTVVAAGKFQWAYADKILQSWNEAGAHTPDEISAAEKKSKPARNGKTQKPAVPDGLAAKSDPEDLDRMRKLQEKFASGGKKEKNKGEN